MDSVVNNFFYPSSVCIPGASSKEKSIGYELLRSIKTYGFAGSVYPVNPKSGEILGFKCYPSIKAVSSTIDLAVVVVPLKYVEETIDELLLKGVKSIIIVTAGFKESGKIGAEKEQLITGKIKAAGARLVGPNCMGVISTINDIRLNASFVAEKPANGATAFLSQSGALGAAVLNSLRETDIKFAHFISVGNKADISENDMLKFWAEDENIKTITMYLESFEKGEDFLLSFEHLKNRKPLIILKAGRSGAGMKAAMSHTGAMGSSDKVTDDLLKQFGIIRVRNLNELFNASKGFENFPVPAGNKIAIITNAGGPAILAVDSLEKNGLTLASLSDETKNRLREIVRPEGSIENPVDLLPGGTAEMYKTVIGILVEDPNVDAVISVFVEPVMVSPFEVVENVNSVAGSKPVFQTVMPLPEFWENYRKNSVTKKPLFRNPEDPAKVISDIIFYNKKSVFKERLKPLNKTGKNISGHGVMSQIEVMEMMKKYSVPVPDFLILSPGGDIIKEAKSIGFPLVVKGFSETVIHKADFDAVHVNIRDTEELVLAEEKIKRSFENREIKSYEILLQKFIKGKHELFIGGFMDKTFGPVVMFGTGGKYVEAFDDTSLRSAHLTESDIDEMIEETKIGKILKGVRGEKPVEKSGIKKLIEAAAQMILDHKEITEFDFNPVIITDKNELYAVDVRIKSD